MFKIVSSHVLSAQAEVERFIKSAPNAVTKIDTTLGVVGSNSCSTRERIASASKIASASG